ncbi:acylase [Fulvivirga sp. RKSG066]|uniref:acylase n=1 Tax=Fulvivirga aurantia TaxID=2529383 RepID=UPI0012BBCF4D|nr:acylase [Fulvivirga aurantia]MTI20404.1 acylase [Fulvivirga aurantia]
MKLQLHRSMLFLLVTLLVSACNNETPNDELAKWEAQAERITIIRDDYGVPHVYGKTDADAVFGLLYAQCEDDFNRVERNYIWAIGRLAEVEGEEELFSDLRARLYMSKEEAIEKYENAPNWLKELCNAFADGINYYLHTHPEVEPKLLTRFEPWMPMYFSEGSIGGDIERVSTKRIKAFYEDKALALTEYGDGLTHPALLDEPQGSNGFAISGEHTASGDAMLLINPHTSFYFRGEVHAVSEEGLNAYGAVTWGQFFIYQGFNEKTGWMHTSTYTDVIDEFKETIVEKGDSLYYQYGEELRPVEVGEVTLSYKDGDSLRQKTFPTYRTHHGPVTHKIDDKWVATAIMWEPVDALIQSFTRTKKDGLDEFNDMMKIKTNSSNNTVYADADGNIAYYHGNFIPKRDTTFNYKQPVDGSNPATDWQGLHPVSEAIKVINPQNGWIQNCNSTPFTSAGDYSPKREDYPYYMSYADENFRGIHARRLLQDVDSLTLEKLIEMAYDPYLPAFEVLIPGVVKAYDQASVKDDRLKEAIKIMREWDYAVSEESVAMSIAHFYALQLLRNVETPEDLSFMERFAYYRNDLSAEERITHFNTTLDKLAEDFGQWNTPWGEINRFQRLTGDIKHPFDDDAFSEPVGMASGSWGALASYGARSYDTKKIYGTSGNSFVAVVEFGDSVKAKSLLAGGQSGDPESPHFDDQISLYLEGKFKDVAYYREDIEKRAKNTYKPGKR